ncbi:LysR family transcriptional regulator (plasmid) [Aminobacter sp. SR38]|uniref:LysR substrate-binding domain-containing protein n=1 Tax=Aminobacter sp. SR38 TaxID=2774562 RepID=UPI001783E7B1|nr:LysR substrate-binding domain-containing protein [Aminobacter sp. SR38]QOF75099.1 LysR family transcriptional regulator [Aminobacter sp. SR38]
MITPLAKLTRLRSLITFEAAARHCNFTHAAAELGVTQAAVSKQIRLLEDMVGTQLFVRQNRGMYLTEPAKKLVTAVADGLSQIDAAIKEIQNSFLRSDVTITTTIATATLWLMPHLADFRSAHPDIDIKLVVSDALTNLVAEQVDLGIRYGSGDWPDVDATFLFDVTFFPACSPGYLRGKEIRTAGDLLDAKLLNLEGHVARDADWRWWLEANGVAGVSPKADLSFNNYPLLVQAAVAGQGVILAWGGITDPLLESGALVRILKEETRSNHGYYLVTPKLHELRKEPQIFCQWLLNETHAMGRWKSAPGD